MDFSKVGQNNSCVMIENFADFIIENSCFWYSYVDVNAMLDMSKNMIMS